MVQLRKVRVNDHSITGINRYQQTFLFVYTLSDEMILNRFICGFMKLVFLNKVRKVCAEMSGEIFFYI